jgi:hypothetical protein
VNASNITSDRARDQANDALKPATLTSFNAALPVTLRDGPLRSGAVSEKLPSVVAQDMRRVIAPGGRR